MYRKKMVTQEKGSDLSAGGKRKVERLKSESKASNSKAIYPGVLDDR